MLSFDFTGSQPGIYKAIKRPAKYANKTKAKFFCCFFRALRLNGKPDIEFVCLEPMRATPPHGGLAPIELQGEIELVLVQGRAPALGGQNSIWQQMKSN